MLSRSDATNPRRNNPIASFPAGTDRSPSRDADPTPARNARQGGRGAAADQIGNRSRSRGEAILAGSLALPGIILLLGMARSARSLQANLGGNRLVAHPAYPDHDCAYSGVWQAGQNAFWGVPYPLLVLGGMLPWQFFSTAMAESGNSLILNSNLISKVYFPRLVIVVSSVITSFVDFLISAGFLAVLMIWYRFAPPATVVFLPFFVLLAFATSLGVGLWIAALMVQYRDFRFIVPFMVQFGLYISPVGFTSSVVPERFRLLYALNPMVAVIDGFRWCLLGAQNNVYWPGLAVAVVEVVALLALGIRYFRATEQTFADVI